MPAGADSGLPIPGLWPWLGRLPDWTLSLALAVLFFGLGWLTLAVLRRWRPTATRAASLELRRAVAFGGVVAGLFLGLLLADPWKAFLFDMMPPPAAVGAQLLEAPTPGDVSFSPKKPQKVKGNRARHAKVNLGALQTTRFTLNLFDDTVLTAVRDREEPGDNGRMVWIGHIEGYDNNSQVVLAARGKALIGTVIVDGRAYEIVYAGGNTHAVRELKPDSLPPEPESDQELILIPDEANDAATGDQTATLSGEGTATGTGVNIGLMVVYTPRALANAGSVDAINAKIDNAVAQANLAYANSGINIHLYLVHTAQVDYTETGDNATAAGALAARTDGVMDEVHALRDQYAADLVTIITADTNSCGSGSLMKVLSTSAAIGGFAAVHDDSVWDCLATHQSLAHELGHAMGNAHNIANADGPGLFEYSYGYQVCGGFHDVMAYPCAGEPRIAYFSNPDVSYSDETIDPTPTGTAAANTALSMNNAAPYVAGFRNPLTDAPEAPTGLSATSPSAGTVSLAWTDNSATETGYRVESSLDGTTWTEVASLISDRVYYRESNLPTGKTYWYRVYAWNPIGNSAYSTPVSIFLPNPGDTIPPVAKISNPLPGTRITPTTVSIIVKASATDNVKVKSLKLYINNSMVYSTTATSISYTWSVRSLAAGTYTLKADALDTSSNTASAFATVTK